MAPPLSKPLLATLPLRPARICPSSPVVLFGRAIPFVLATPRRTVSKMAPQRRVSIPPEAPSYLIPPLPPQSTEELGRRRERGHLPVPRKIMRNEQVVKEKSTIEFLKRTAPRRKPRLLPRNHRTTGPKSALAKGRHDLMATRWKARSAHARRANLRAGIRALAKRKEQREKAEARRTAFRRRAAKAISDAPEDEADRLTRTSVPLSLLNTAVMEDPQRMEKAEKARIRTEKMYFDHSTSRRDSIMQMYVNAKGFIVNEEELANTVENLFREDYFKDTRTPGSSQNVWADYPPGMDTPETWTATGQLGSESDKRAMHTAERQQKLAEALAGGKLIN